MNDDNEETYCPPSHWDPAHGQFVDIHPEYIDVHLFAAELRHKYGTTNIVDNGDHASPNAGLTQYDIDTIHDQRHRRR